jgi:hypothetical protein
MKLSARGGLNAATAKGTKTMLLHHGDREVAERRVVWAPWSPAQLIALAFGIFLLILGAVTLSNTGIHGDTLTATKVSSWGFGGTALLILAGAIPGAGRTTMALLGVIALGAGIAVLASQASLYDSFGVNDADGWLFLITGIVNLLAAMLAPVIFGADRRLIASDSEVVDRERF